MCEDTSMELVDERKIISNLWTVTLETKKLPEIFDRLEELFTFEERTNFNWMEDDHVKSFLLYRKFIREYKDVENRGRLLKALRATDNNFIADQIMIKHNGENETEQNEEKLDSSHISILPELKTGPDNNEIKSTKNPPLVDYEVDGKHKMYSRPDSLRISQGLQHLLTKLKLKNAQITTTVLKRTLQPCFSLQDFQLYNVSLTFPDETNDPDIESPLVLPRLQSYEFHSDSDDSTNYSWDKIFFFSIVENVPPTLVTLCNSRTKIDVISKSMIVKLNPDYSTVCINLSKKEYYDCPNFIPYISTESVCEFFRKKTGKLHSFTCLLPEDFANVPFSHLPEDVVNFRVSGLNISYSTEKKSTVKFYQIAVFEKCTITQNLLNEISTIMPLVRTVQFKECQIDNCEGADININMTY